jgi:TPR repeat protein
MTIAGSSARGQQPPSDGEHLKRFVAALKPAEFREYQDRAKAGNAGAQAVVGIAWQQMADALRELSYREQPELSGSALRDRAQEAVGESRLWLGKAAEQGIPTAQLHTVRSPWGDLTSCARLLPVFTQVAQAGNPTGMYELGRLYLDPPCEIPRDYPSAQTWLTKAAGAGNAPAMYLLGELYRDGKGVPRDHAKAFEWLRKAAENGHPAAQAAVGVMLADGDGGAANLDAATGWLQRAADGGDPAGAAALGQKYAQGLGVAKDKATAAMWLIVSRIRSRHGDDLSDIEQDFGRKVTTAAAKKAESWVKEFESRQLGYVLAQNWIAENSAGKSRH